MKKRFDYTFTVSLILLGSIHVILTPVFYKTLDTGALWFAGTGLAFVFLGIINVYRIRTKEKATRVLCAIANGVANVYCILIVIKLAEPQAYISLVVLLVLFVFSLMDLGRYKK